MKKYRVVTDNLDWVGIPKGTELHEQIDSFYSFIPGSVAGYAVKNQYDIYAVIAAHPEWLSEIKEDKEEFIDHRIKYSENDLLKFGRLVRRTFNFTDSDSVVKSLLSDYKAEKSSPKEEAKESSTFTRMREYGEDINKEFTRDDLVKLAMFLGNEQWWKPTNTRIQTANFHDTLADLAVTYFITTISGHK